MYVCVDVSTHGESVCVCVERERERDAYTEITLAVIVRVCVYVCEW